MAISIGTNRAAMAAASSISSVSRDMQTSYANLASGKRINTASDDAAGVALSSRLSAEIRGTEQAIRNTLDAQALIDTTEGAHKEIENILQRMREITIQASNDTNNSQDRQNLQAEMTAMSTEIDRVAATTSWGGKDLMYGDGTGETGTKKNFGFQVGTSTGTKNIISAEIGAMSSTALGLNQQRVSADAVGGIFDFEVFDNGGEGSIPQADVTTSSFTATAHTLGPNIIRIGNETFANTEPMSAEESAVQLAGFINDSGGMAALGVSARVEGNVVHLSITPTNPTGPQIGTPEEAMFMTTAVDFAIKDLNTQRVELGAVSNRLNHTVNNLTNISANLSAARGGIQDADFALETMQLAKSQILQQASTAMLAQANALPQNVLSLF